MAGKPRRRFARCGVGGEGGLVMLRRPFLLSPALLTAAAHALPMRALQFPRDHGAHPDLRTEWWYLTGYANVGNVQSPNLIGFQITFFRSRIDAAQSLQSRFAAKQLIFAHAAVTDVRAAKHWHDQRIAREGFGIAQTALETTDVKLRDWSLQREADGRYTSRIIAREFSLDLQFTPTQPLLLQGNNGLSRKGPEEKQASYYYSQPQLSARGTITLNGRRIPIQMGTAWLDHEWSEEILHPEAVGWDWIGMNLLDGSSLTAFQLRKQDGSPLWAAGLFRTSAQHGHQRFTASTRLNAAGQLQSEVLFSPQKFWASPATGARYPVEWLVRTHVDIYTVRALLNSQEMDSRASTGTLYWEGLAELIASDGKRVGLGYLEMTGYAGMLLI
jgi:predicted secreted hydrolase